MGNYQSVTVNEHTQEENISLEKQAAMQEEAARQRGQTLESDSPVSEETEQSERPEWLDEKFESPEDLAKAYKELQKKQSSKGADTNEESKEASEETTPEVNNAVTNATTEFAETGQLSDKAFLDLEKAGIPREFVEAYIQGQEALSTASAVEIQNSIGGAGNYEAMSEWAGENLSDGDLEAFNNIVEKGSVQEAQVAVKGLYAQFVAAGGQPPNLNQGTTSAGGGPRPFGSAASMVEAMQDPRYKNDPAYRQSVEKRLAVSNAF